MRSKFHRFFIYSISLWLCFAIVPFALVVNYAVNEKIDGAIEVFAIVIAAVSMFTLFYLAISRLQFQTFHLGNEITIVRWPIRKSITVEYADIAYAEVQQRAEDKEGYHYVGRRSITRSQSPTRIARRGLIVLKNGIQISLPDTTYSNIEAMIAYIESKRTL